MAGNRLGTLELLAELNIGSLEKSASAGGQAAGLAAAKAFTRAFDSALGGNFNQTSFKNSLSGLSGISSQAGTQAGKAFESGFGKSINATFGRVLDGALQTIGYKLANLAQQSITVPIQLGAGITADSAKKAIDYSSALNTIKVNSGATSTQLAALDRTILQTSVSLGILPQETAETAVELTRAGVGADQLGSRLKAISELSIATGDSVETATTALNALVEVYSKLDDQSAADILTTAANASPGGIADVGNALKYSAAAASNFNVSARDLAQTLVLLQKAGLSGETAGTSLRSLLNDLSKKAAYIKDGIGVDVYDKGGQLRELPEIIKDISNALGKLSDQDSGNFLKKFSANSKTALLSLKQYTTENKNSLDQVSQAFDNLGGKSSEFANKMSESSKRSFEKLAAASDVLETQFGRSFEGAIAAGANLLGDVATELLNNTNLFGSLNQASGEFATMLGKNPALAKMLADAIADLSQSAMSEILRQAEDLFSYLEKNPDAISSMVDNMKSFARETGSALLAMEAIAGKIAATVGWLIEGLNAYNNASTGGALARADDPSKFQAQTGLSSAISGFNPSGGSAPLGAVQVDPNQALRLALLANLEASTKQGQLDVTQAVFNRLNSGNYGSNLDDVMFAPGQFQPFFGTSANQLQGKDQILAYARSRGVSESDLMDTVQRMGNPDLMGNSAQFVGGRTDFKGVSEYSNRNPEEDPLRVQGENFFHISGGQTYAGLRELQQRSPSAVVIAGTQPTGNTSPARSQMQADSSPRTNNNPNTGDAPVGIDSGLVTAPSSRNGGSTEFHIDMKFASSLSPEERRDLFDEVARANAAAGRGIEFSNSAVAGERYNLEDPKRGDLLERAFAAHDEHSTHPGLRSVDFYNPVAGANRFDRSTEGSPEFIPTLPGGRLEYETGGGYGNHASGYDEKGNLVFMVGHGDTAKPLPDNRSIDPELKIGNSFNVSTAQTQTEQERLKAIQEAQKNQDEKVKIERESAKRAVDLARQNEDAELDSLAIKLEGNEYAKAQLDSLKESLQIKRSGEDKISGEQNNLADLQTQLERTQADPEQMKQSGIQEKISAIQTAIESEKSYIQSLTESTSAELANSQAKLAAASAQAKKTQAEEFSKKKQELQQKQNSASQEFLLNQIPDSDLRSFKQSRLEIFSLFDEESAEMEKINEDIAQTQQALDASLAAGLDGSFFQERISQLQELRKATDESYRAQSYLLGQGGNTAADSFQYKLSNDIFTSRATQLGNQGDTFGQARIQRYQASEAENRRYQDQLTSLSSSGLEPDQLGALTEQAGILNRINLDNIRSQFKDLGSTIEDTGKSALGGFFQDILGGTKSLGEAFRGLISNLLSQFAQLAANSLVSKLFGSLFGGKGGSPLGGGGGGGDIVSTLFSGAKSIFHFGSGGEVPFAPGSSHGQDSVLAMLMPGEFVLSHKMLENLPKFAEGGYVQTPLPVGSFSNGGSSSGGNSIRLGDIHLENRGGGIDPAAMADQVASIARKQTYEVLIREKTKTNGFLNR